MNANTTLEDHTCSWAIDPTHSEIGFKVRHLMIAHLSGYFKRFKASIQTMGNNFETADIHFWIDVSSLDSGDAERDAHLRSPDFFDATHHPQITFNSNTIGKADNGGNHEIWGELTIKGITRNVQLFAQFGGLSVDPLGNEKAGFTVSGRVNRKDWGLEWNTILGSGGMMIGEDVQLTCEVELINVTGKDIEIMASPRLLREGI
jgi:polyisoprenoid-binding protein YceI